MGIENDEDLLRWAVKNMRECGWPKDYAHLRCNPASTKPRYYPRKAFTSFTCDDPYWKLHSDNEGEPIWRTESFVWPSPLPMEEFASKVVEVSVPCEISSQDFSVAIKYGVKVAMIKRHLDISWQLDLMLLCAFCYCLYNIFY